MVENHICLRQGFCQAERFSMHLFMMVNGLDVDVGLLPKNLKTIAFGKFSKHSHSKHRCDLSLLKNRDGARANLLTSAKYLRDVAY